MQVKALKSFQIKTVKIPLEKMKKDTEKKIPLLYKVFQPSLSNFLRFSQHEITNVTKLYYCKHFCKNNKKCLVLMSYKNACKKNN